MTLDGGEYFAANYFQYVASDLFSSIFAMPSINVLDLTVTNHDQGKFELVLPPSLWRNSRILFVRIEDGDVPHNKLNKKILQDICKNNCKKV